MDPYLGQLVVLRLTWNLDAHRVGVVVEKIEGSEDKLMVMWTTKKGIELKVHLKDALMPVTSTTDEKVKERICVFK